jgi:F0F1-type ATP synthase assembly protein I
VNDAQSKRQLNKGFADAVSRSFELVVTVAVFTGLGWLIDGWLGTSPLFLIVMTVLGFMGNMARSWYSYDAAMTKLEVDLTKKNQTSPVAAKVGHS